MNEVETRPNCEVNQITMSDLPAARGMIARRPLGKTGVSVSPLGLGGNRLLTWPDGRDESARLVERALDLGVAFFDTARLYPKSEVRLGQALGERREEVFLASKTHARDRATALAHLGETLRRLKTDHLDLWQLHDVRTDDEVRRIFGAGGAIEALVAARREGLVRYLGVTGHRSPQVICRCLEAFDFDTVMIPVNPAERHYRSFLSTVLPVAASAGVGVVAMYAYCGGRIADLAWFETVEPFLRFSLSQPVSTVLVGCDSAGQLEENVRHASRFVPMDRSESDGLADRVAPHAARLMYYKFPKRSRPTKSTP